MKFLLCKLLGLHKPQKVRFDKLNLVGTCKRCGKRIYMDDDGKWVEY